MVWPVKRIGKQAIATAAITGISNAKASCGIDNPSGAKIAETPSIAQMLKILLPKMLPTAISFSFFSDAMTEVATSGKLVPAATIVKLMTSSSTPKSLARSTAPWTRNSDPMNLSK